VARKLIITSIVLVCAVAGAVLWMIDPFYWRWPKDDGLLANFRAHTHAFEDLRAIISSTPNANVFTASSWDSLGQAQQETYQTAFRQIGSSWTVTNDRGTVRFIAAVGGSWISIGPEWIKGIEYISIPPEGAGLTTANLDDPKALALGDVYLRPIDQHWYLFVQKSE
jgi:hypothetical protein